MLDDKFQASTKARLDRLREDFNGLRLKLSDALDAGSEGEVFEEEGFARWTVRQLGKMGGILQETMRRVDRLEEQMKRRTNGFYDRVTGLEKKVEATYTLNAGTAQLIGEIQERLDHIQSQYVTESGFEDLIGRVRRLETESKRKTEVEGALITRIRKLEENPDFRRLRILERITALENGSRLVGTGGLIEDIENRLSALEGYPRRSKQEVVNKLAASTCDPHCPVCAPSTPRSASIQFPVKALSKESMDILTGTAPSQRAESEYRTMVLNGAADRVLKHMSGGHFSAGTIRGVVQAVFGGRKGLIRDHVYQGGNQIGDLCNFVYSSEGEGWPGMRCARREDDHMAAGDVRRG
jgi:hypothetical protein